jgi:hypothetical protein
MRQILQNLKNGKIELAEVPVPKEKAGHLRIQTTSTLISAGTERMLLEFGKANVIDKARHQPEKVKQVKETIFDQNLRSAPQRNRLRISQGKDYTDSRRIILRDERTLICFDQVIRLRLQ